MKIIILEKELKVFLISALVIAGGLSRPAQAQTSSAGVWVQCPGDTDGDAVIDQPIPGRNVKCMHLAAGDGFVNMADGRSQYMFGFSDVTGVMQDQVMHSSMLKATFPAPTVTIKEGQEFYLTLTNVGMMKRPDLSDPHSVHFHGFPNAAPIFDGVPEASIAINMGASQTFYYNIREPGTFMYHCHVEAPEHMQMGMLGNLFVLPAQNDLPDGTVLGTHVHHNPDGAGPLGDKYVYNDGDASTYYDVEYPIQLASFDPEFHDASLNIQPLPFANMKDKYAMMNGRGYPETINPAELANSETGDLSQKMNSLITAQRGQKVLIRLSNLSVTNFYTVTALGLSMKVVGSGARILRGPDLAGPGTGKNLAFDTSSVTLGGGEATDVIIDTSLAPAGTYFLYTTNLNFLSNNDQDFGGMMTEIVIN